MTCEMPRRTISAASRPSIRSPSYTISPWVSSPSSEGSRPEIAFSVVDFPAPFEPSRATISPSPTVSDSPRKTRITWS
jgi:hypothetical protein